MMAVFSPRSWAAWVRRVTPARCLPPVFSELIALSSKRARLQVLPQLIEQDVFRVSQVGRIVDHLIDLPQNPEEHRLDEVLLVLGDILEVERLNARQAQASRRCCRTPSRTRRLPSIW